jgi:hypothetical protein
MKPSKLAFPFVVLGLFSGLAVGLAQSKGGKEPQHVTPDDAKFKEVLPGVSKAVLWGDDAKGPYGAFTRFKPGHKNSLHSHSSDIRLVVLKGAYLFGTDKGEKRVGPHGYLFIPGGTKHTSAADEKEGVLFYEESQGKFDLIELK